MPEEREKVLIAFLAHGESCVYVATFRHGAFWEHNAGYDGDEAEAVGVAHWMPMPSPPKEDADAE
jgi:hypothetical protein